MSDNVLSRIRITAVFVCLSVSLATGQSAYKVLHNFGGPNDGFTPLTGVVFGPDGKLYGTTRGGSSQYFGSAFQMTPNPDGTWSESVIYNFSPDDPLGDSPSSAPVFDNRGNLFGTTSYHGSGFYGTLFELTPGNGGWNGLVLHAFTGGSDGGIPGALISTNTASFYGGTAIGGVYNEGIVFNLGRLSVRNWYELVLQSFGAPGDSLAPYSLVADTTGNLYGTAAGGQYGWGIVFKLTPNRGRSGWTETILHSFTGGPDGGDFNGNNLVLDAAGNVYGTTVYGGGCGGGLGGGVAFNLSPNPDGTWSETVIYAFACLPGDPVSPLSLTFDRAGDLLGESAGGPNGSQGTVFKLTPSSNGVWSASVLHSFINDQYGVSPSGGVVLDSSGNIYGTTELGGTYGFEHGGVVFEITP